MRFMKTAIVIGLLAIPFVVAHATGASSERRAPIDDKAAATAEPVGSVVRVGPQRELKRPSAAARAARDGDTIEIDAGIYDGDVAVWTQNRLTIRALGGVVHLRAAGQSAEGKAIWVVKGRDTTIEGIEFSGARVSDRNGAGIRAEGPGLTVRRCNFHDNENGILTGSNADSDIVVENSVFARNGSGDGQSHNIYIGRVRTFRLRFNYVHHAVVGHDVKSRARSNFIAYNRIMDETDGRSSYSIDLPDGGVAFVIGNLINQGPAAENSTVVSYGAEGLRHPANELYFVNNTVVNDRQAGGRFVFVQEGTSVARIENNVFSGPGTVSTGPAVLRNNVALSKSDFVDPRNFDYRLKSGAPAIGQGADPGTVRDIPLKPMFEYRHPTERRERVNARGIDAGALEFWPD
jgi:hypothetical protein